MTYIVTLPPASASLIEHADAIELNALFSADESYSFMGYARDIRITGSTDAMTDVDFEVDPHDRGGEQSSEVTNNAWMEIERRAQSCGGDDGHYPFDISETSLSLKKEWRASPYIFQLLLARFGFSASEKPINGARLFEKLCSFAAREHLGGDVNGANSIQFGFPRPDGSNFLDALLGLCKSLGEGVVNENTSLITAEKDSHLDIVAWLPFRDGRGAQIITFGQCATGKDWDRGKLSELQPTGFCQKWLREMFCVTPIRVFFVPRSIEDSKWRNSAINGGVIFDRCRISWCAGDTSTEMESELSHWIGEAHEKQLRQQ